MIMARLKTSAALVAIGLCAACGPVAENGLTPVSNASLYSVNQPVVQRTDFVFDVNSSGDGLSSGERARLDAWFRSIDLSYGDRLSIADGGYADARTRGDIARLASSYGLLIGNDVPFAAGAVQPGAVRVIVSRSTASVPGCPIWEDPQLGVPNRTSTNFGCAINSNLAQMVADPNDLVLGQNSSGDLSYSGPKAVKTYRDRTQTGVAGLSKEAGGKE
jgi:pilus assembly protein CpaD